MLNLPSSSTGNRALGDTLISLLHKAWRATASEIEVPASKLAARMVDWNFGEDEPVPGVLCTDLGQSDATADAISALVTCGAMTPDEGMDNTLRNRFGMPERTGAYPAAPPAAPPGPREDDVPPEDAPGGTGKPPVASPVNVPERVR